MKIKLEIDPALVSSPIVRVRRADWAPWWACRPRVGRYRPES